MFTLARHHPLIDTLYVALAGVSGSDELEKIAHGDIILRANRIVEVDLGVNGTLEASAKNPTRSETSLPLLFRVMIYEAIQRPSAH